MEHVNYIIEKGLRFVTINGRQFAIAPITIIVPGVLPGSKGPLYYPPEEIARNTNDWNGKPLIVYHAYDEDNTPISAANPRTYEKQEIGRIYNARIQDSKLVVDGYFDLELTKKIDSRVYNRLMSRDKIEVSTGLFTDNQLASPNSTYGDKPYTYVARNYKPDHLAILPDEKGACSITDGCGVFNKSEEDYTYFVSECPNCGSLNHNGYTCLNCGKSVPQNSSSLPLLGITDDNKKCAVKNDSDVVVNPSWVKDHDKWSKAKEQASKEGKGDDYAYITGIYKKMGGTINSEDNNCPSEVKNSYTNNEDDMNRDEPINWLIANCSCYKNDASAKQKLTEMSDKEFGEVIVKNAKTAIDNEDVNFLKWIGNASPDIRTGFVKLMKNALLRNTPKDASATQTVPPNPNPATKGKQPAGGESADTPASTSTTGQSDQTAEAKKAGSTNSDGMMEPEGDETGTQLPVDPKKKKVPPQPQVNKVKTMEEYLNDPTVPKELKDQYKTFKKVTDQEKKKLIGIITANVSDDKKKTLQQKYMEKTVEELEEIASLIGNKAPKKQQDNGWFAPTDIDEDDIVDNSNSDAGYNLEEDTLVPLTINYAQDIEEQLK